MLNLKIICSIVLITILFSCSKSVKTKSQLISESTQNLEIKRPFELDISAQFVGGNSALAKYLQQNLRYPPEAQRRGITGKVFVNFVILKTGEIYNVTVPKETERVLIDEAKRIVRQMPKWKPAMIKGEPVNSEMVLPITFDL
jgi:periplasmic protein TonB